jgi:hypothetical protein
LQFLKIRIFFPFHLDTPNQLETAQQFEFYVEVVFDASRSTKTSGIAKNDHLICPTGKSSERRTPRRKCPPCPAPFNYLQTFIGAPAARPASFVRGSQAEQPKTSSSPPTQREIT